MDARLTSCREVSDVSHSNGVRYASVGVRSMADPGVVRQQALKLFQGFDELEQPELLVMPILLDAISLVEAYRFVRRKDVSHLPELTGASMRCCPSWRLFVERTNGRTKRRRSADGVRDPE
jgi:hypothetical protein